MNNKFEHIDLKDIAYIRVLEYAANEAVGYKIRENNGFTYQEIIADEKIKHIDKTWLKSILISICNIYHDDKEIDSPSSEDITKENTKLVIKSEEFMKFINLVNHEITNSKLEKAHNALLISIAALFVAILSLLKL